MSSIFCRRKFLALASGALAVPSISWPRAPKDADDDDVPTLLDHILLGCNDLDRGIEMVEEATGVRPPPAESIPAAAPATLFFRSASAAIWKSSLRSRAKRNVTTPNSAHDRSAPHRLGCPSAGHRRRRQAARKTKSNSKAPMTAPERPDGRVLNWKTINLATTATASSLLHRWSADSVHLPRMHPQNAPWTILK